MAIIKTRLVLCAAALLAAAAVAEEDARCPRDCNCSEGYQIQQVWCNQLELTFRAPSYATVECGDAWLSAYLREGLYIEALAADVAPPDKHWLPSLPAIPSLLNVSIDMMSFVRCPVPRDDGWGAAVHSLGVAHVQRLFLTDAPLEALEPARLRDLPGLRELELNGVSDARPAGPWTPRRDLLQALPDLVSLSVRAPHVRLEPGALAGLDPPPPLEVLELGSGWVEGLTAGSLAGLPRLRRLSLWNANVSSLPAGALAALPALEMLELSGNKLTELSNSALGDLSALRELHVIGSKLRSLGPLSALTRLQRLAVTDCATGSLIVSSGLLTGMSDLRDVRLLRCGLPALDEDAFRGAVALQNLSLSDNSLSELPATLFRDQARLERLDLSGNQLSALTPGLLAPLRALLELNLERNRLSELPADAFVGLRLVSLRLAHNALRLERLKDVTGAWSPLRNLPLERLDLSHNNLSQVCVDWTVSLTLRSLDLSYNQIEYITDDDLAFLSANIDVDLSNNRIKTVKLLELAPAATASPNEPAAPGRIRVLLGDNPFDCDCRLHLFVRRLRGDSGGRPQLLAEGARCAAPRALSGESLARLPLGRLRCSLPAPACPERCGCSVRPEGRALELRCAVIPLPAATPQPGAYGMLGTELRLLEAPGAGELRLRDDVQLLNLSGLGLHAAPRVVAAGLRVLDLSRNSLRAVPAALLSAAPALRLRLAGNPLRCDCNSIADFDRLLRNSSKVDDFNQLECVNEAGVLVPAGGGGGAARCGARLALWAAAAALLAAAAALALLYCRYERQLKVLLYARGCCTRWLEEDEGEDAGARYDAFVSYSHKDSEWVLRELAPRLESGGGGRRPLRLCLHQRDWIPGEWIPAQIARSVAESRRTLLVLSEHFLSSVWAREEWQAAHVRALRERRPRVLVVRLSDVPTEALPPDLRTYLATNTYLQWGDPRFWDKLRYALPRVPRAPPAAPAAPAAPPAPPALLARLAAPGLIYNAADDKKELY